MNGWGPAMNDNFDDFVEAAAFEPPQGFVHLVVGQLDNVARARKERGVPRWLPWAALTCGTLVGLDELASFMLSAWIAVAAN